MIRNIIDLGHYQRKFLRIQKKEGAQAQILSSGSLLRSETQTSASYWDLLDQQLHQMKKEWNLGKVPLDCLLPASFFEYSLKKSGNADGETRLETSLEPSLGTRLNQLLEHKGMEATFLGSGLTSITEFVLRYSSGRRDASYLLVILTYSCAYRLLIKEGKILELELSLECRGEALDDLIREKWEKSELPVESLKSDELILLPVYRKEQEMVEGFQRLVPYFHNLLQFLRSSQVFHQSGKNSQKTEILLSDGGALLRNLSFYLQGILDLPCRVLEPSFFHSSLDNRQDSSDLSIIFNPLLAHSALVD